jgi:hypothetical protein
LHFVASAARGLTAQPLPAQVEKQGVGHLSSLSEPEQMMLLERVQPAVMRGTGYRSLLGATSQVVGQQVGTTGAGCRVPWYER